MLEWIESNKNIVFSGLGTGVLIFILGKIFVSKPGGTLKQRSGKNSTNIQASGDVKITGKNDL